jgi:hypothetical protein
VSQQPAALRLPSQCELQENAAPSIVEGLKKRSPTYNIAKIHTGTMGEAYFHKINRDTSERYQVIITDGDLQVFDIDGTEKTVTFPDGKAYLSAAAPETDFRCVTIADYTFVVNRTVDVAMDATQSPDNGVEAIVFIKQANYKTTYTVYIDGTQQATHTTPDGEGTVSSPADPVESTTIAEDLKDQLVTNLGAGWSIDREGSVLHIRKDDESDFEIKVEDSRSNTNIGVAKDSVQKLSDLPVTAPTDFRVKIEGVAENAFDAYYVKFRPNNDGATFDSGVWVETVAPGIDYQFDASTMPHGLIRESDGTFTFQQLEWGAREAGDDVTAPKPTFVGNTIRDVFFSKNRLGLLSDENAIMSRAGEYFEFFPTTVTTSLDSDPIDIPAPTATVSFLEHAVNFNENLLFFSDQDQIKLEYGDVLSPETAELKVLTSFESSTLVKPVSGGKTVFFAINQGSYAGVREYYIEAETATKDAAEVTAHVPKYIPTGIFKMAVATNEELLFVLTKGERNKIYVYNFYWVGNEKLQSAWHPYVFPEDATILNVEFINTDCYLIIQYADGVYMERMSVEPGRTDEDADFEYLMDRKVDETDLVMTYDSGANETTVTFPYQIVGTPLVVQRSVSDGSQVEAVNLPVLSTSGTDVVVKGDVTGKKLFAGIQYTLRYRFSQQTLRENAQGGGQNPIALGRMQLRRWSVVYSNTGYFNAKVLAVGRDEAVYKFTGRILGSVGSVLGQAGLYEGTFHFPVLSKNDRVTIELESDSFLPCHFLSAEWEGFYSIRSKRL